MARPNSWSGQHTCPPRRNAVIMYILLTIVAVAGSICTASPKLAQIGGC